MTDARDTSKKAVAKRLKALRASMGNIPQEEMADILGIERSRYNNWENGFAIPVEQAIKIRNITGATLDYIYLGDISGLPMKLALSLRSISNGSAS